MFKFTKHFSSYVLMMAFLTLGSRAHTPEIITEFKNFEQKYKLSWHEEFDYDWTNPPADSATQQIMNAYIDSVVSGTNRIITNKKAKGYRNAVRAELPGAPMNRNHTLHCLYGLYTQLNRAMIAAGDTVQIIPHTDNAHKSTSNFKRQMSKLYDNSAYYGVVRHGHLYATESDYIYALQKYLKSTTHKHKGDENDPELRKKYTKQFEQNNFCATMLNPGSIIIVDGGHAIMYLGQGTVKNREFIPDSNGTAICTAYNKEHPAISLKTWHTNHTYAVDIQNIIQHKHNQEELSALIQIKPQQYNDNCILNSLQHSYQR